MSSGMSPLSDVLNLQLGRKRCSAPLLRASSLRRGDADSPGWVGVGGARGQRQISGFRNLEEGTKSLILKECVYTRRVTASP